MNFCIHRSSPSSKSVFLSKSSENIVSILKIIIHTHTNTLFNKHDDEYYCSLITNNTQYREQIILRDIYTH